MTSSFIQEATPPARHIAPVFQLFRNWELLGLVKVASLALADPWAWVGSWIKESVVWIGSCPVPRKAFQLSNYVRQSTKRAMNYSEWGKEMSPIHPSTLQFTRTTRHLWIIEKKRGKRWTGKTRIRWTGQDFNVHVVHFIIRRISLGSRHDPRNRSAWPIWLGRTGHV